MRKYCHRYKSPSGLWVNAYLGTPNECPELRETDCEYRKGAWVPGTRDMDQRTVVNAAAPRSQWSFLLAHERGHVACDRIGVPDHWIQGALSHRIIDAIAEELAPLIELPGIPNLERSKS